ncbi:hypothetical protein C6500_08795 [Candidatus Poribacteria bacterium]|nr:MAG: hypothetical protein C6500_08795 [Candidatus Poribacteria bacterium]
MSKTPLKYWSYITVGSSVICFRFLWLTHTQPQPPEKLTSIGILNAQHRKVGTTQQKPLTDSQISGFHRTIIDNNLFRPLEWHPPRQKEIYRLLGTLIPTDENTPSQAILQSTTARTTYIVSIGDTLDTDTTVTDIQWKQVTLEKSGQQRILTLNATLLII